jgi:hypothetical protein
MSRHRLLGTTIYIDEDGNIFNTWGKNLVIKAVRTEYIK